MSEIDNNRICEAGGKMLIRNYVEIMNYCYYDDDDDGR